MTIARPALDEMVAHARETAPHECCGLLVGRGEAILTAVRARNLSPTPTRYEIDPQDHFNARHDARAQDLDVVGFYHSHPATAAVPSPSDIAEAAYPEAVYVIVGSAGEARAFRMDGGAAQELMLIVESQDVRI